MKKLFLFFLVLIISFNFVSAIPELPMIINGNVLINEKPAEEGIEITAKLNGEEITKIEIKEKGKFSLLLQKLDENDNIELYVDNIYTGQNINYKSGDYKQLILKVEKSYLAYYIGGIIAVIAILLIIWRLRKK